MLNVKRLMLGVGFLSVLVILLLPLNPAQAVSAACKCTGTVSAGILLPNAVFDGYCEKVKGYCQSCGGGTATCSIDLNVSPEECGQVASDPKSFGSKLGVPAAAFIAINVSGSCNYLGDAAANAKTPAGKAAAGGGQSDRLLLPACTKTGDCKLSDIVQTGVNFASFIMGLSAALFFAVFIYGGAMYLTSFGDKTKVDKGKKAIVGASIGIVLVMGAWTIVKTLVSSLGANVPGISGGAGGADGGGAADKCAAQGEGWSCQTLTGKTSQEAIKDGEDKGLSCKTGLCPGPANALCCKAK